MTDPTPARVALLRARWPLAVVAVVLGLLAVGQFRGLVGVPGLANLSVADLGVLVANLNAENDQLRIEVASLERQRAELATANTRGQSAVEQLRSDLARVRAWAGLTGLRGSGVTITVRGTIGADGVEDLANELRNAGAEAIAVSGVRLVPGVVVSGAPGAISIEGITLDATFEIKAIGSPQILTGTLTRSGGVIAQLGARYPDAQVTVTPADGLTLPPTNRDLQPADAQPHL